MSIDLKELGVKNPAKENSFVYQRLVLYAVAGSHSYGINTPDSDLDRRGICIPPIEYLLGLHEFESYHRNNPDEAIYSLAKFVHLALQNNPNILDILFVEEDKLLYINDFGWELRELAKDFLSKRVYHTYGGYAQSQLHKMQEKGGKGNHGVRQELIEKVGYDSKHAVHLVRLLRMGCEILETGEVHVFRPDREELMAIRRGEYSLDEILKMADSLRDRLVKAYENTKLPDEPNTPKIEKWLIETHKRSLEWRL